MLSLPALIHFLARPPLRQRLVLPGPQGLLAPEHRLLDGEPVQLHEPRHRQGLADEEDQEGEGGGEESVRAGRQVEHGDDQPERVDHEPQGHDPEAADDRAGVPGGQEGRLSRGLVVLQGRRAQQAADQEEGQGGDGEAVEATHELLDVVLVRPLHGEAVEVPGLALAAGPRISLVDGGVDGSHVDDGRGDDGEVCQDVQLEHDVGQILQGEVRHGPPLAAGAEGRSPSKHGGRAEGQFLFLFFFGPGSQCGQPANKRKRLASKCASIKDYFLLHFYTTFALFRPTV